MKLLLYDMNNHEVMDFPFIINNQNYIYLFLLVLFILALNKFVWIFAFYRRKIDIIVYYQNEIEMLKETETKYVQK